MNVMNFVSLLTYLSITEAKSDSRSWISDSRDEPDSNRAAIASRKGQPNMTFSELKIIVRGHVIVLLDKPSEDERMTRGDTEKTVKIKSSFSLIIISLSPSLDSLISGLRLEGRIFLFFLFFFSFTSHMAFKLSFNYLDIIYIYIYICIYIYLLPLYKNQFLNLYVRRWPDANSQYLEAHTPTFFFSLPLSSLSPSIFFPLQSNHRNMICSDYWLILISL